MEPESPVIFNQAPKVLGHMDELSVGILKSLNKGYPQRKGVRSCLCAVLNIYPVYCYSIVCLK